MAAGYAPALSLGASGFIETDRAIGSQWRVADRLSGFYLAKGGIDESWGSADVSILAGVIEVCPVWVPGTRTPRSEGLRAQFELGACPGLALGRLASRGHLTGATGRSNDASAFYADGRLGLRPRLVFAEHFLIDAEVGIKLPLMKYDLVVGGPPEVVYELPKASGFASAGLALRFP
jgi:hypothetical protein